MARFNADHTFRSFPGTRRRTAHPVMVNIFDLLIILLVAGMGLPVATVPAASLDVVVYGGTSAGVAAAVQVARFGKSVVLIEPTHQVGGLTTNGLGATDTGNKTVIGGYAREFYRDVKRHYDQATAWQFVKPEDFAGYRPGDDAMWTFEPHVAEQIMERHLAEAQVPVVRRQRLDRQSGVELADRQIRSITMESGERFAAKMFIDATYEGDLLAAAGVPYTVGRESNQQYGETLNGVQANENKHNHRFRQFVDPFRIPGDRSSGLVPLVHAEPIAAEGSADHRIQAYCFRMCMSNVPENRVPFAKPDAYDERVYELLFRNFAAGDLRVPMHAVMMPNGKTDTNNNGAFSTDHIGANYRYPEASFEEREEIVRNHADYQKGLMWTLAHHPRVPASVRREMQQWGLSKDEFVDNGHWPYQIYVREARRMVSDYVVTEHDCRRLRATPDSVGMGSYNMDSHNVQRYVTTAGGVQNEGDVQVSPGGPYSISYRAIVPGRQSVSNLAVPVCLSSSHIAFGSVRMEPVFMILGQSAASAACLAIDRDCRLQDLPYSVLRSQLDRDGQVVELPGAD